MFSYLLTPVAPTAAPSTRRSTLIHAAAAALRHPSVRRIPGPPQPFKIGARPGEARSSLRRLKPVSIETRWKGEAF